MNYYIGGDFNINVLMYAKRPQINNYCNIAHSMASHMIINKPTRFPVGYQNGKPSILDHIYVNKPSNIMQAGLILNDTTVTVKVTELTGPTLKTISEIGIV